MAPTATGSKARWALQARRKACMDWSWAAACGVLGREHIVRRRAQLVHLEFFQSKSVNDFLRQAADARQMAHLLNIY